MTYYSRKSNGKFELLIDHLKKTGKLCEQFASAFNLGKLGNLLGEHHDLGKATLKFDKVLNNQMVLIDHAIIGSWIITGMNPTRELTIRKMLGYIIASHHSNLNVETNLIGPKNGDFSIPVYTLDKNKESSVSSKQEYDEIYLWAKQNNIIKPIKKEDCPDINNMNNNQIMFLMRMLYSCLVDADYCCSAEFTNTNYLKESTGPKLEPQILFDKLIKYRNNLIMNSKSNSDLNQLRNIVFEDCLSAGNLNTGLYSLTAPTGTAKTLALISFALKHALKHNKERIFVILPHLSIIQPNAQVYRDIFGVDIVLEDDSNVQFTEETKIFSERWSSPIIITTSVKFFETLFASKSTSCRRLHHLANSVVVFDEAHTLPSNLINNTLEIINELPNRYNTTVLFSTASPLDYSYRENVHWQPIEIIKDVKKLYEDFSKIKQLKVTWDIFSSKTFQDLIDETYSNNSMYMFNTRKIALKMYNELLKTYDKDVCYYLSSDLCPKHKLDVIEKIKINLKNNKECRLSTTSCVEAGVCISFKQVFRMLADYLSFIQSAGRNDRECLGGGHFTIFSLYDEEFLNDKKKYPSLEYQNAAMKVKEMLINNGYLDINDLNNLKEYSNLLFNTSTSQKDKKELCESINNLDFENTTKEYKLIDSDTYAIIVPYSNCMKEYNNLKSILIKSNYCITSNLLKTSQPFTVNTFNKEFILKNSSVFKQLKVKVNNTEYPINYFILEENTPFYSEEFGLTLDIKNNFIV